MKCLFLGAGASKALAQIPTGAEFSKRALTEGKDRKKWIDRCEDSGRCFRIGNKAISSWILSVRDIEICMSHLYTLGYDSLAVVRREPSPERHAVRSIINFRSAIADYLRSFHLKGPVAKKFKKWIESITKNGDSLTILTTNYDLTAEQLFAGESYYYPEVSAKKEGVPIYKLHGSINWLEKRWVEQGAVQSIRRRKVHYIPLRMDHLAIKKRGWAYFVEVPNKHYERKGSKHITYNPVLIPFMVQKSNWMTDKTGWNWIFQPHWKSAMNALAGKNLDIYFIGYSLPPADYSMMTWLISVLNKVSKKTRITIICKGQDELLERALGPFIERSGENRIYRNGLENYLKFLGHHT